MIKYAYVIYLQGVHTKIILAVMTNQARAIGHAKRLDLKQEDDWHDMKVGMYEINKIYNYAETGELILTLPGNQRENRKEEQLDRINKRTTKKSFPKA